MYTQKNKISIITPLYHGIRFIPLLLENIEKAAKRVEKKATIEWIISNDDPQDIIEEKYHSELIHIVILNTDVNRGIQGARVTGLEKASGNYVLFLDQDDVIAENWIDSQLKSIGDADGVVCECLFDDEPFYNGWDRPSLDICITKEYNINEKNGFVPGQVLLRKSSIPSIWKKHWLKWNCCDDQFLWLTMFGQGAVFVSNKKTCYYHRKTGNNQSKNLPERYLSNCEMIDAISSERLLPEKEEFALKKSREKETLHYLKQNVAQKKKIFIYNQMLECYEGKRIILFDKIQKEYKHIGIIGLDLGKHLFEIMNQKGISIECFIDRNNKHNYFDIPIVKMENILENVDVVINTILMDNMVIHNFFNTKFPNITIIDIQQLFDDFSELS